MVLDRAQAAPLVMSVMMEEAPVCRHHWIIEPANGRHSRGDCQNCHEVRAFENSIYEAPEAGSQADTQ